LASEQNWSTFFPLVSACVYPFTLFASFLSLDLACLLVGLFTLFASKHNQLGQVI